MVGEWGFRTSRTSFLMSVNEGLAGVPPNRRCDLRLSPGISREDLRAAARDNHRVLGLRDDPVADVVQGRVGVHEPGPEEPRDVRGRLTVEAIAPSLREREAVERLVDLREEPGRGLRADVAHPQDAVDIAGLPAVDLSRPVRRE